MEDSSWEDSEILIEMFQHLNLEDQVQFDRGRNITEQAAAKEDANITEENATEEDMENNST